MSASSLHVAPGLKLDADYVAGGTFALLAKKGAGKTYTGRVMAEEMWSAKVPFVALDPMGAWWGLRSSDDGEQEGIPVAIFGGEHGDAPLERGGGKLMADLFIEERLSMILDMSAFGTRSAERQFALDFLERLYRGNRDLMHLFVDEADLFAPQKPQAGDQPLLGVAENIVRRGRNRGIGCTLITQRSAVLNKDVLTQVDGLVAMRMLSPQDRSAIDAWVHDHADPDRARQIKATLPELQNGECWWWVPELDVLKRVQVRRASTFDSSPTKKRGQRHSEPRSYADVDMDAIESKMADTIKRAKADDPRELRKQIAALHHELETRPTETKVETVTETLEVSILGDQELERLEAAIDALSAAAGKIVASTNEIGAALGKLKARPPTHAPQPAAPRPQRPTRQPTRRTEPAEGVTPAQQRILNALAMLEVIGVSAPSKIQLALFARASPKSSGYTNNLGALRSAGLIDYPAPGAAALTVDGRTIADQAQAPGSHDEMLRFVRGLVGPAKSRILDALVDIYPDALPKDELAQRAGASASSSGYTNNLGSLRSLGLIDYPAPGYAAATSVLFLEAA